jgi:hypothetical protein
MFPLLVLKPCAGNQLFQEGIFLELGGIRVSTLRGGNHRSPHPGLSLQFEIFDKRIQKKRHGILNRLRHSMFQKEAQLFVISLCGSFSRPWARSHCGRFEHSFLHSFSAFCQAKNFERCKPSGTTPVKPCGWTVGFGAGSPHRVGQDSDTAVNIG